MGGFPFGVLGLALVGFDPLGWAGVAPSPEVGLWLGFPESLEGFADELSPDFSLPRPVTVMRSTTLRLPA